MGAVYETGEYEPDEVDLALASPSLAGDLCGTGHVARPDVAPSIKMIATSVNSTSSVPPVKRRATQRSSRLCTRRSGESAFSVS